MKNKLIRFPLIQKAKDYAVWLNFTHDGIKGYSKDYFGVALSAEGDYLVLPRIHPALSLDDFEELPPSMKNMDYRHIRALSMDADPLLHWETLLGMISTQSNELLRFTIALRVPLKRFIRYELASRGYDMDGNWCGFEKAKEIWLT